MKIKLFFPILGLVFFVTSCSVSNKIGRPAKEFILENESFINAHTGISVYEPATNKYWYNYQAEKYFVPASNTKLATCYAAMKYLKDSLVGLHYLITDSFVNIVGTGDPTFLDPEFKNQPVFDFLKRFKQVNYLSNSRPQRFSPIGRGWAWGDYTGDYAAERSEMPIYDNVARFYISGDSLSVSPHFFYNDSINTTNENLKNGGKIYFDITRPLENNSFYTLHSPQMLRSQTKFISQSIPFKTFETSNSNKGVFIKLLEDTLHKKIGDWSDMDATNPSGIYSVIHSQPTDSLLKPLMHRSDNFYAEQSLLMVSQKILNYMSDRDIIDTLLNSDYKLMPQKPLWVDGSGLSRYNLFSPKDFVFILKKMKNDFGMERIKNILATGGTGTIKNYYIRDSGFIFAKTGTLNGVVAFSGFLYTIKNKLLIFSVLVNNHRSSSTDIRKGVEKFIQNLRDKY